MNVTLPLDKMTVSDKIQAMEQIWSDLLQTPDEVPSPAWHQEVLRARERSLRDGSARFRDWDEAKKRVRNQAGS